MNVVPSLRLVWLAALSVPFALVGLLFPPVLWAIVAYDVVLLVAAAADAVAAADPRRLRVQRRVPSSGVQGRTVRVELRLSTELFHAARVVVRDLPPRRFQANVTRFHVRVPARAGVVLAYEAVAAERGVARFGDVALRTAGPLGLIWRQTVVPLPGRVRIYPDLITLSAREASLVAPSPWQRGRRRGRSRGAGREFHQLRGYVPGDDVRQMDWKAYARRGRPTVREYRAERNQRVLLVLDAGRLMTVRVGDRTRFDWAVQAAGRLARVALGAGDLVGLAVFSREIKSHVPGHRKSPPALFRNQFT